ncbi:hypothetical protein TPHA_0M01510 [Tetrapisispora phaffii CBS 4417]|uniref:Exocyst complex component Sec8 n=1 Tax=Tetrapisispora phaffii (strain ATCC 24235 / CBS 4417 / NBRC 1672 / NRRL Y-8282 / UCD 70-5) TaxID=1071381 RepID=G8C0L1_TETPH|nr:hypothetical protein TPHA_0M01510 [Tetrapisispora phaffii CBS 4417]CCE65726.1 hypothetical protein TPHA_0M01510 [Tetrapisispora phaffii CBS 4417]
MDNLAVQSRQGRTRALSVNTYDEQQRNSMSNSLDKLEMDLSLIQSQWNRIITDDSNPLELALKFLDDTSVGLGHRFDEFNQLKEKIGYDLQNAVNEHYQVFNTNIASYSIAVNSIANAQNNIENIENSVKEANLKINQDKGSLQELNESTMSYTKMIDTISAIEEIISLPEKMEDFIRKEEYREAQKLLKRAMFLSNTHSLWSISSLTPIKQQIDLAEHNLFQNMIDELHDIIYSKKSASTFDNEILEKIHTSKSDFTSTENYLYTIVSIDIDQQSENMNIKLKNFLENIKNLKPTKLNSVYIEEGTDYDRIFNLLILINSLDKLPLALRILVDRATKELHDIVIQSSEEIRSRYPSLMKIGGATLDSNFGMSMRNPISIIMREWFWKIFVKILLAVQRHRVIFESVSVFQQLFNLHISYRFGDIWKKCLIEVRLLLNKYLNDTTMDKKAILHRRDTSLAKPISTEHIFTLQSNLHDNSIAKNHTAALKTLLQDIFPGFSVPGNINLSSIYVEEESYEEEEALIQPTVFNMRLALEPVLLFIQATSNIIPSGLSEVTKPSMSFLSEYMKKVFIPKFESTLYVIYDSNVFSNNPYAFESNNENKNVLKSVNDFYTLFCNTLTVMNTTYTFRANICSVIINILEKFQIYYEKLFQTLLGVTNENYTRKLLGIWMNDEALMGTEFEYLKHNVSLNVNEAKLLFRHCSQFYYKGNGLKKDDIFNNIDLDIVLHFYNSLEWALKWFSELRKTVDSSVTVLDENSNANDVRLMWSLYDCDELSQVVKTTKLRLSMDVESVKKFDSITEKIENLKYRVLTSLRFDLRARVIFNIGKMFKNNYNWSPDVGSTELESSIGNLISDIRMHDNKLKSNLDEKIRNQVGSGIDIVINYAFISGATSIKSINTNGIKKINRNITYLQNVCRNVIEDSNSINMNDSLNFYTACGLSELQFFKKLEDNELSFCTKYDLKNIIRLIYGDDAIPATRKQRDTNTHVRATSMSGNKRYNEAIQKINTMTSDNEE